MSASDNYAPSLRERQKELTRDQIVATAFQLLEEKQEPTHEAIAEACSMAVRTVYRHFPSRDAIIAAAWDHLKAVTATRFPITESEIVDLAPRIFRNFDSHEALVRAFLSSGVGTEVRDKGAEEGRRSFTQALGGATAHPPPVRRRQAVAIFLALYSAPAWQLMRDRGQLSRDQAADAIGWAASLLLNAIRTELP